MTGSVSRHSALPTLPLKSAKVPEFQPITLQVSRDDLIDAIESLEQRAVLCRGWSRQWAAEGFPGQSKDRAEQAHHYDAVAERLRKALEASRGQD